MKKFFKILGIIILVFIAILYICFLFVLPRKIDLSKYNEDIKKIVSEQANLNLEYENLSLITTPALGAGIKADNLKVKLPDESVILSSDSIKVAVSIPKLLLYTIKVPVAEFENPFINAEIMKNGEDYKLVKHIENIINEKKQASFGEKKIEEEEKNSLIDFDKIKIIIPNVKLNNYKILITDLATDNYLDLHGEKLSLGYFNRKRIKVKTQAELFSNKQKNVDLNIDVSTFLPDPSPKLDTEDDPAERTDFHFLNPVTTYQNYDLKTNINSKIKIYRNKEGEISSYGYINIDDLAMKISTIQLPKSYFHIKTFGTNVDVDTNLRTTESENIQILGKLNYGKHPNTDINIKTAIIHFENLFSLSKAFLDSLNIPNELNQYKPNGTLEADCTIKTNFRKLKSTGFIKIKDGSLAVRNLGEILSKMNINIILNDNILDILDSKLSVSNSEIKINGTIDEKSNTDINIKTDKLPISPLFNAFANKEMRNKYVLKAGTLSSSIKLNGKMKEAISDIIIYLNDLNFSDKSNSFNIVNKSLSFKLNYEAKTQNLFAVLKNKGFNFVQPKTNSKISIPETNAEIYDNNIEISPNLIHFNDKSAIVFSGIINNYLKPENINFTLQGSVNTEDIIKFIGQEMKPYIHSKGTIPIKVTMIGNAVKQTFLAQALADENNFITPIDFDKLQNLKTSLQAKIDFKPGRIKIKDTGLFTRASVVAEDGSESVILNQIIDVDGTIEGDTINLLKIDIPKNLTGKLFVFNNSAFNIEATKLFVYNKIYNPLYKGSLRIKDIKIPELYTSVDSLDLTLIEDKLNFALSKILFALSDLNINGIYNLKSEKPAINNLNITSDYINVDNISVVTGSLEKYLPKTTSSTKQQGQNNIPIVVQNGSIDLKKILTGNIEVFNTKSQLTLNNNILALRDLTTDIFKGKVAGRVLVDLISMAIDTDLQGKNINVEKALLDSSGVKNSLSGTADFNSKLTINGASKTPEEQMKGIKGDINFIIKNGQFGPFGKLENLILAENIRESKFFQTALGGIINSLATIDTTHFSELVGAIQLKDGICKIDPITSKGNAMNIHILGNFDILKNYADMKVRIKLTSIISDLLGPLNAINPVNLVNSAASMNVVTAKAFSLFCETVPEEEINILPKFDNAYVDKSATKFQLGVRGDAAKPLTLIKSFKWLATPMQFAMAKEFADSLPDVEEGEENATIEQARALEEEKKTFKYKLKHFFKKKQIKKNPIE